MRALVPWVILMTAVVVLSACAEPPHKEMNQAQGAIDAARAAGAEQYAAAEFRTAVEALQQSETAAAQRDYRLALSRAIDSREQAQVAAKTAGDARAKARGDAERVVAVVNIQLTQARERLADPVVSRLPRRVLDPLRLALDAADKSMQGARAALTGDDYAGATRAANDVSARIHEALRTLETAVEAPAVRKRR